MKCENVKCKIWCYFVSDANFYYLLSLLLLLLWLFFVLLCNEYIVKFICYGDGYITDFKIFNIIEFINVYNQWLYPFNNKCLFLNDHVIMF